MTGARLPHSEIPGSQPGCRLPEAYRRLPRPSSAPDAKASTVCPYQLTNTNPSTKKGGNRWSGNQQMLASTMQFTKNNRTTTPTHPTTRQSARHVAPNSPRKPTPKEARFLRTQQCAQPTQAPDTGGSTPRTPPPAQGEARLRPLSQEEPSDTVGCG